MNSIIRSENAANIQLVVNAKDLRDLLDGAMAFAKQEIIERERHPYYTREEMKALLGGISDPTLNSYRKKGLIPEPLTIDGKVLYDKAEVKQAISNNRKLRNLNNG